MNLKLFSISFKADAKCERSELNSFFKTVDIQKKVFVSKWFWNSWVLVRHCVALASALRITAGIEFRLSFSWCWGCCLSLYPLPNSSSISLSLQKFRNIHNKVSKWVKAPLLTSILQTFSPPWHEKYPELCNTQNGWYIFIKKSGMIHNNTI